MRCLDKKTGNELWQDRTFPKATFLYADGKLIVVDEDGNLLLATVSPAGLKVLSRAELLHSNAGQEALAAKEQPEKFKLLNFIQPKQDSGP